MIGAIASAVLAAVPSFATLTLDTAESRIVANSASVATTRALARQRESDLQLAKTGGIPHLVGDYSLAPQAGQTGTEIVEQHLLTIGAGISINDIVNAPAQTRVAAAELLAAQRDADAAALQARADAVGLYFSALQAIAVDDLRRETVRSAERDLSAARIRAQTGEAPKLDVMRAEVSLAQAQAEAARATADRANATEALASAARVNASELRVAPLNDAMPPAVALDEERAVTRALAFRPELASLLAALEARKGGVAVARQAGWPLVTASGGYQGGVDTGVPVHGPQAAVRLDIPLAPGTADRVASAQAQVDAAQIQLLEARRTIALAVASAVRTARASQTARAAAERARDQAQRSLDAVELGYREGASSSLDVAEARRTYVQAAVDALVAAYANARDLALIGALVP
jgi:outer membrane protein TolC